MLLLAGCGSSSRAPAQAVQPPTASNIKHLVVLIQENHSFDSYFAAYCTAATGSNPTCTTGPSCCETAPSKDPGSGMPFVDLDDMENGTFDPNHTQACELQEIDNGKMDMYVTATDASCGSPHNFARSDSATVGAYWSLAQANAMADHYFQPLAGQSSSNDMYFARAGYEFTDNDEVPSTAGGMCAGDDIAGTPTQLTDPTIGDLLVAAGVPWAFYAEGYQDALDAQMNNKCAAIPADCPGNFEGYPCIYDPGDNPFEYYTNFRDNLTYEKDFATFGSDVASGKLPPVSFVKAIGYKTEHPGVSDTISAGVAFTTALLGTIMGSAYASDTLVLVTWDESGGYYDHVSPPPASPADMKPYGDRVPLLAIGPFVEPGLISHTTMEHSSIVKFIEWNWLGQQTGQLRTRDTVVNNLGSLLDPSMTGVAVPVN
jgi:phospholipase C